MLNKIIPGALLFALLLLFSPPLRSQSPKQIEEAFKGKRTAKKITFYCKSRKQYNRKVKRLLRIMDRKNIYCNFGVEYKKSKIVYFTLDYKNYR